MKQEPEEPAAAAAVEKQRPVVELQAWLARQGLSPYEAARRLGMNYSVLRRVLAGETPNARTLARISYGTDGQLGLDELLPADVRQALKRRYRGALLREPVPGRIGRRRTGPREAAS